MVENRIQMPQSGGGLIRYFEEYKSKIEMSPQLVIGVIIVIIILEIIFHKINLLKL